MKDGLIILLIVYETTSLWNYRMFTDPCASTKPTTEIESLILETNLERPKSLLRPGFVLGEAFNMLPSADSVCNSV